MDTVKQLNVRKKELIEAQDKMLRASVETKTPLSGADETAYANMTTELDSININIARFEAIAKGKAEVGTAREQVVITDSTAATKFYAFGGRTSTTALPAYNQDAATSFWASLRSKTDFDRWMIQNASLGELGSSAAGGALVPVATDPSIPNLAIEECSARSLSRVITTDTDLYLPYQASLTVAALKSESNSGGTNAFATNAPTFGTTKLSAYTIGDSVTASWELLRDVKAASTFLTDDIGRAIVAKEENLFINGSGTNQPQGYLGNGTTATGASITAGAATLGINAIIDTMGSLNKSYYQNAKWLVNRAEFNRLLKAQIAASQFQTFITFDPSGSARLFGYQVNFSGEMPTYVASPATTGAWMFGDFNRFATIGDRGDSNIRIKVLDQVQAVNGQTVILGYRYADQRIIISQAVVQLNTNG